MTTAIFDPEIPPRPDEPCSCCGAKKWWLRKRAGKSEWICGVCHPNPDKDQPTNPVGFVDE